MQLLDLVVHSPVVPLCVLRALNSQRHVLVVGSCQVFESHCTERFGVKGGTMHPPRRVPAPSEEIGSARARRCAATRGQPPLLCPAPPPHLAKRSSISPGAALQRVRGFVEFFFGCESCAAHFLEVFDGCQFGRCDLDSADGQGAALWLWRVHNAVTTRVAGERGAPAPEPWPVMADCAPCWPGPEPEAGAVFRHLAAAFGASAEGVWGPIAAMQREPAVTALAAPPWPSGASLADRSRTVSPSSPQEHSAEERGPPRSVGAKKAAQVAKARSEKGQQVEGGCPLHLGKDEGHAPNQCTYPESPAWTSTGKQHCLLPPLSCRTLAKPM